MLSAVNGKKIFAKKMEFTREHFRAIIFHNIQHELSRQECIDELKPLYGDEAPS